MILAASLASTPALAQDMKSKKSLASRTKLCKADCLPDNIHGLYKSYHTTDPKLVGVDGKKQYAQCVKSCLGPLPPIYVQRAVFALGIKWFGQTRESCLDCHERGY